VPVLVLVRRLEKLLRAALGFEEVDDRSPGSEVGIRVLLQEGEERIHGPLAVVQALDFFAQLLQLLEIVVTLGAIGGDGFDDGVDSLRFWRVNYLLSRGGVRSRDGFLDSTSRIDLTNRPVGAYAPYRRDWFFLKDMG
jgi:hypothetical protein